MYCTMHVCLETELNTGFLQLCYESCVMSVIQYNSYANLKNKIADVGIFIKLSLVGHITHALKKLE